VARNHYRARKRRQLAYAAVSATLSDVEGGRPDGVALSRETGALVESIVVRLPLKQRLAFIQRKIHGLEYPDIGASLECSAESARAHVFQALRKIRNGLDEREGPRKESRP
jgi:DNA-directed RNA polymerase specialized sigma24 family protein